MRRTERGTWIRAAVRALRRVAGAPDYDAYLEHCRRAGHAPRVTESQFVREFFDRKERQPRCC